MAEQRSILYAGYLNPGETSRYRYESLIRLGPQMFPFPVEEHLPKGKLLALAYRLPAGPLIARANRELLAAVRQVRPDIVWFDKPTVFTQKTVGKIKQLGALTVCYNQDNPFGPRRDGIWRQLMKTLPLYDLHCLVREADVERYRKLGLPFVKLLFSYEPSQQFPPSSGWSDRDRDREVSYVGSPHEERPAFLERLAVEHALPLAVAGPRWRGVWGPELRAKYVSSGFLKEAEYRETIWRSRINLAFITHLNEDDIAHKAVEIAACGGFLLAERSPGHKALFEEDWEAVFFSSVEECAEKARYYLDHPAEREAIADRGRKRAAASGYDNDSQLALALERLAAFRR